MRLIDANARVTVQSFDIEHVAFEHTEMSVSQALDFATDEGCPPVVEAIPVEWLTDLIDRTTYADRNGDYKMWALHGAAYVVLQAWQTEREAQNIENV